MAKISLNSQNHNRPHQPSIKGELHSLAFKAVGIACTVILFVMVALVAWQLGIFVTWLQLQGASSVLIWMLKSVELILTGIDLAGLVYSTWNHLKH